MPVLLERTEDDFVLHYMKSKLNCHWRLSISFVFVCFVALRPSKQLWSCQDGQLTLPHLFLGKLEQAIYQYFVYIHSLVTDNNPS